ncbi:DNA polymerase delta subunit 3-like isoform X1 [Orbicella faveolata]|uniref:DNA polymerase delta subunit 3-like isoform X1 n=1 Tax=Orbicella faveolata TaxID=48498 RepID=UPI0009E629C1|nr:DNA polymerase delta subunit 3-like isoform X1 [Orbicella faveolata]
MADDEELYLANLDEFVNDEDKIVTYKWLSRTLSVPVNKAKQMLYAFAQKQKTSKSASHLNITYIVGGRCSLDGEKVHRYVITQDENLEETKKSFSVVTSLHIYSIQKCQLKDSNSLYTVDYDMQRQHNNESNRWSHVHCSAAVPLADKGVSRGTRRINGLANGEKCPTIKLVNGSCEPGTTQKGTSNLASEQKGKIPGPKSKKGQMSALESMFAAKPSSSKPEKSKSEKPQDSNDASCEEPKVGQGKTDSNKAGSIKSSFFGKATTVKKASEKPGSTEKDKEVISKKTETVPKKQNDTAKSLSEKKRELPPEDDEEDPLPSEISKAIKSDSAESKVVKGDKKEIQKKEENKAETTKK